MPPAPLDPADDIKPGEPSEKDEFVYKRDSVKTLRQIGAETQERIKKAKKAKKKDGDTVENPLKEEEAKPPEKSEETVIEDKKTEKIEEPKIDHVAIAAKAAEDAAKRVAEETKASFKEEIAKILDKDKDMLAKQEEADALISAWDKEKRLPKDYNELIAETMRIADAKYEQKAKAEAKIAEEKRATLEKEDATKKEELAKKQGDEKVAEFTNQITQDLSEIYEVKELPRPAKLEEINNPDTTDPAAKETQKVLQFGIELNQRLVKEGKPPVTSLNKIYFLHYKPYLAANPAKESVDAPGADAPVAGAKNTPTSDSGKKIDYNLLHNETWAQTKMRLAKEFLQRQARK